MEGAHRRRVRRHLILIGLPGAGKTTVARLTAQLLGAAAYDCDALVVRGAGRTIPAIFADEGESGFRRREREAMATVLGGPPAVTAAGGGWAAQPGSLEGLSAGVLTIYLECAPETAAARVGSGDDRPLVGTDRVASLRELWRLRHAFYERADHRVDTNATGPAAVAARVAQLARSHGGW